MGTGGFNVALDIDLLVAHTDGGMTPAQVAMTPYDTNSSVWSV